MELVTGDHVVGKVISELPHRRELVQLVASVLHARSGVDHPLLVQLKLHTVALHLVNKLEYIASEPPDRRRTALVVTLVAVAAEAKQPGSERLHV